VAAILAVSALPASGQVMRPYKTKYYVIHTDLPEDEVREAAIRMTTLFREYGGRSKGFKGGIRSRMVFRVFTDEDRYIRHGGPRGSAGFFHRRTYELAALADEDTRPYLWHVVQHEAFHQFAHFIISQHMPVWANEGMAEYFGRAIWIGDDYITGVITPFDRLNIVSLIDGEQMITFREMMSMELIDWNMQGSYRNYLQAWSMIHFFAHAEDGKYLGPFDKFLLDLDKGRPAFESFRYRFPVSSAELQKEYNTWWRAQAKLPTDKDIEAVVGTLTAYLARAHVARQPFETTEAFFKAARAGELKHPKDLWLPPALLAKALDPPGLFQRQIEALPTLEHLPYGRDRSKLMHEFELNESGEDRSVPAESLGTWRIVSKGRAPTLVLTGPDGTVYSGSFKILSNKVKDLVVEITRPSGEAEPTPSPEEAPSESPPSDEVPSL